MHLRLFRLIAGIVSFTAIASLHAQVAPTIASVSSSQTITEGQSVTLSVSVNGTTPFTYQWRKDSVDIDGATASSYTLSPALEEDDGVYTVLVTNTAGSVNGGPIIIAVAPATAPSFYYSGGTSTITAGDGFSFYPYISGSSPITYQWYKNGTAISGATSYYFSKSGATSSDAGSYTLVATNAAGSATSSAYTLTVNAPTAPTFSSTPSSTTVTVGNTLNLYAYATGSGSISYQWYKDGAAIYGATYTSYTRYNVTADDAGTYTVTATNSVGSITSSAATVTITPASSVEPSPVTKPTINSFSTPYSKIVVGNYFYLSVSVSGTSPFTYQWYKDGAAITGATNYSYSISSASLNDAGVYSVVVTNSAGSATSEPYVASIVTAGVPMIIYHPSSRSVNPGSEVSFSVGVSGSGSFTYQWNKDGTPIAGANSSSLYLYNVKSDNAGSYTVTVTTNSGTLTSNTATLTVLPSSAPEFTVHPASMTLRPGETFSVSATATGYPIPTFQWQRDDSDLTGATSSNYSKSSIAASDSGSYTLVATNSAGTTTSNAATLTVFTPETPVIVSHPASASLLPGGYYTLSISLRDNDGATVQWYRDGTAIVGATYTSYSISGAQPSHAGAYHAVVTNPAGSATSRDATITLDSYSTRPDILNTSGSQAVTGGGSVTLQVSVASGATTQWYKDDVAITGATETSFSISNFSSSDVGTYTAKATLDSVTTTSVEIALTLRDSGILPRIINHPAGRTATIGNSASFYVSADGEQPLTYQWKKDGNVIAGATGSSYYISSVTGTNAGNYTVTVTNAAGSTTSEAATLSITTASTTAPVLTQHPTSQIFTIESGGYGYLSLYAYVSSSSGSVTYQWKKDGVAISGATSNYYYKSGYLNSADSGSYTVTVTNSAGSVTSDAAIVTVMNPIAAPVFTTHPTSATALTGSSITFTATASSSASSGTMTYQWKKNGVAIASATSASLTLSNVDSSAAGAYTVVATDVNGATASKAATLTISTPVAPVFTQHPSSVTVSLAGTATFTAVATGSPAPSYQWYRDGGAISGATSSTLTVSNTQASDIGSYTAVATNSAGSATSNAATLSISFPYVGTYFGQLSNGGLCAMYIREDRTALFLSDLPSSGLVVIADEIEVDYDGSFLFTPEDADSNARLLADRYYAGPITGQLQIDKFTGELPGLSVTFSGGRTYRNATYIPQSGYYESVPLGTAEGIVHAIVSDDGRILLVSVDADGVRSAYGAVTAEGAFSTTSGYAYSYTGSIDPDTGTLTGTYTPADGSAPVSLATPAAKNGPERLANLSTRGVAGTGNNTLIAGLVVTGSAPKDLLIRAVGPTLETLGVTTALSNPRLTLFQGGTAIAENDDWGLAENAAAIAETTSRITGLPFPAGSADAAMLMRLNPGTYTIHVTSVDGSTGVAMVEAYDANDAASGAPKLINISTRGGVGTGDNILIVGLVVGGDAPKRLLIRAMGPGLADLGVSGVLADPKLSLYQGGTLIRSNDDWSAGSDAAAITAASKAVTGFTPAAGSKDSAMLLYLAPGSYTAQVSGVNDTTGVALVEVYEVP